MLSYVQDYDERFCRYAAYNTPTVVLPVGGIDYWWQCVEPYMKNMQILACPSRTGNSITSGGETYSGIKVDYSINTWIPQQPISDVQAPAANIVMVEGGNNYARWYCPLEIRTDPVANTNYNWHTTRHNGTSNYLFVDGHVKTLALTVVDTSVTPAVSIPARPDMHMHLTFHP